MNTCPSLDARLPDSPQLPSAPSSRPAPLPAFGTLGDVLRLLNAPAGTGMALSDATPIGWWRVRRDATLMHEGTQGHTLFVLRCGSMKCVKTLEDGYEQVLWLAQAGDLLGFEALYGGMQPAGVVALEDSSVYSLPVADLPRLREHCPALADALQRALSRQLTSAAAMSELMAAVSSEARLARFLLWWSQRMVLAGRSPRRLRLPMGRRDIASLIGVAHATVSRSFTTLADAGCLRVSNRDVEIVDFDDLHLRARNTRCAAAEACGHAAALTAPVGTQGWVPAVDAAAPGIWPAGLRAPA